MFGVASFYSQFHFEPRGRTPSPCAAGRPATSEAPASVLRQLEDHLGVRAGDTTPDLQFTLETVACFGSCALAPVVVGDGKVHGRQTGSKARVLVDALREAAQVAVAVEPAEPATVADPAAIAEPSRSLPRNLARSRASSTSTRRTAAARTAWAGLQAGARTLITVGTATCGLAAGAGEVVDAIRTELAGRGIEAEVVLVGCVGMCFAEPLVEIATPGLPRVTYQRVAPGIVSHLIESHLVHGEPPVARALGTSGEGTLDGVPRLADTPVMRLQVRNALRNCGVIDPTRRGPLPRSRRVRGTAARPGDDPRGGHRGGHGVRAARPRRRRLPDRPEVGVLPRSAGDRKYVICNADEGDPGAFMDRSVLEGDPHAVLEGIAIAGYAMGASHGYVYVRAEYPLAVARLELALRQMRELGLLGDAILGTGFAFDIEVKQGAGAFVCGEETALIASIEGRRGMPRPRPPFPATKGLFGQPSNINNVETLANVPAILREGAAWFAAFGTETSKGTKTFALTGKINRPGLIEVPWG